ncbi:putative RNA recognition motif containing protein [Lyophyllum shimeji]|uniref:RNA recognition motif containing protein n=1 Tax=Lyophyllum shimeji TaxID=47721 RepID=A0A9P3UM30_LYOSH|nr:putative RNA recognition motif containing protein [Lyophyllum shimeji]
MPPKPFIRMRTWGTRFDTLPTSPPVSPPARAAAADQLAHPDAPGQAAADSAFKRKEEKMPHDASVFVGSLPSNIDQQELTRLLSEHLSEHTEVKNIKVVRDSKGGVCAFVQCEDAASAATLIYTLHSNPPKQFLGRTLRYEPARAFRTLLISYRTPMQTITGNNVEGHPTTGSEPFRPQAIELKLPFAMRVWRPRNSKFYSLLYNGEAVDAENYVRNDLATSEKPSLFLQPVLFDAETIRMIAAYFGRLERIEPFQLTHTIHGSEVGNTGEEWKRYPAPHDAPRSPGMDTRCWEIKWEHRDDCVSALMTLRRVPHLTVTWAHQPAPFGSEQRSPYSPFPHNNVAQYPLHVQDRLPFQRPRDASFSDPFGFSQRGGNTALAGPVHRGNVSGVELQSSTEPSENAGGASDTDNESHTVAHSESPTEAQATGVPPVRWSDMDFPPLGNAKGSTRTGSGVWSEGRPSNSGHSSSPSLALSRQTTGTYATSSDLPEEAPESEDNGQELEIPPTPGLGRSPLTPKTPGSEVPATPATDDGAMQRLSFKDSDGKDHEYYADSAIRERHIDPTTLFVGGLETFGPGAWDEEKVGKFFSRFGGLESVKIVRPLNSHAAFAFVKFDNTESPARAVFEEHNRVYEGRAMRVQLRDCNPPRGPWRHNRGRGRFYSQNFSPHRRVQENPDKLAERSDSSNSRQQEGSTQGQDSTEDTIDDTTEATGEPELPLYSEAIVPRSEEPSQAAQAPQMSPESGVASPGPPFTTLSAPTSQSYREWYDEPLSTAVTPPPSASFGSSTTASASGSALSYSMTNSYYTPTPWLHPYGQPMQYPMPYMGYPGYPVPGQPQIPPSFVRPPGSDASGTVTSGSWPAIGMYGSYIPYQAPSARTPTLETPPSQPLNSRAPLVPTGFIQNEQGTLIAVYQPEALDQYMAGAHAAPPAVPQHPVPNIPSWQQYPQSGAYPFSGPPPAVAMPPRPSLPPANVAWVPNQGFTPQQQQNATTPHIPQTPQIHTPAGAFRGGYSDGAGQVTSPSFRRQTARRDQNNPQHNQGRNNQPRSFPNRNSRGHMNNGGYHGHGDPHAGPRNAQFNQNSSEWNQWGAPAR